MKKLAKTLAMIMAFAMVLCLFPATAFAANDGVLDVGMSFAFDSLTPFRANTGRDQYVLKLIYEQLGVFDENQKLQPWGAKGWSTEDNLTWNIEIWDNIVDAAGNHITADDVVWFITESKARGLKPCFAKVASVEKTGDYSLSVTMTLDQIGAFDTMCSDVFMISQAAFEASADEFASAPVTTSMYKVTDFQAGSTYSFEKRDDYWQDPANLPACVNFVVPKVCYHTITEASQMGIALETGVVDVAVQMDLTTAVQYVNDSNYTAEQVPGNQGWTLFFSGADSRNISKDVNLCRAICCALDNADMVQALCSGYYEYPHQFSGGMKQRVVIAIALACNPSLLLADEPTTALDVTIQAQVLDLIGELRKKFNTSMLLITHDMGVVAQVCDTVAIIYAGSIVEYGTKEQIFDHPSHPYTIGLFGAIPDMNEDEEWLHPIDGLPPDPTNLPKGCPFGPRCKYATDACRQGVIPVSVTPDGHQCRCCHMEDVRKEREA